MHLSSNEILTLLLSISIMLIIAKIFSELFIRFKMPAVIGQIIAGILLGPTCTGSIAPNFFTWLFPSTGLLKGIIFLGLIFIMVKVGIEVELSSIYKQGRSIAAVSFFSILIPFVAGFIASWYIPAFSGTYKSLPASIFFAIVTSITALPVIAKILLDVKIFHSDLGMIILTSAMVNDITGWILFSSLIKAVETGSIAIISIITSLGLTLLITIIILTIFRYVLNELLPIVQARTEWPGGVITLGLVLSMFLASLTEAIGIHAFLGAFLGGIILGDSPHLNAHTKEIINQFIDNFFSPLFFVSIGLGINLITQLSLIQACMITLVVFISNIIASLIAGKISNNTFIDSLAIGVGMSTSGTMGIIVGIFALQYGIINTTTYSSIVVMAVATSLLAGPLLKLILKPKEEVSLIELLDNNFIPECSCTNRNELIQQVSQHIQKRYGYDANKVAYAIIEREQLMSTGIGQYVAIPHARIPECKKPVVICATHPQGLDFDAPDGKPAKVIFMVITPQHDNDVQIFIISKIAQLCSNPNVVLQILNAKNNNEFIAILKTTSHIMEMEGYGTAGHN